MIFRNLSAMINEIVCDNLLRKFEGNKSINREDLKLRSFYENVDPDYAVIEDHINFLITDKTLQEAGSSIRLTTKGWFILTNADKVGYVAQKVESAKREMNERDTRAMFRWTTLLAMLVIAGMLAYRLIYMQP
jgi:hypothetical protein